MIILLVMQKIIQQMLGLEELNEKFLKLEDSYQCHEEMISIFDQRLKKIQDRHLEWLETTVSQNTKKGNQLSSSYEQFLEFARKNQPEKNLLRKEKYPQQQNQEEKRISKQTLQINKLSKYMDVVILKIAELEQYYLKSKYDYQHNPIFKIPQDSKDCFRVKQDTIEMIAEPGEFLQMTIQELIFKDSIFRFETQIQRSEGNIVVGIIDEDLVETDTTFLNSVGPMAALFNDEIWCKQSKQSSLATIKHEGFIIQQGAKITMKIDRKKYSIKWQIGQLEEKIQVPFLQSDKIFVPFYQLKDRHDKIKYRKLQ